MSQAGEGAASVQADLEGPLCCRLQRGDRPGRVVQAEKIDNNVHQSEHSFTPRPGEGGAWETSQADNGRGDEDLGWRADVEEAIRAVVLI